MHFWDPRQSEGVRGGQALKVPFWKQRVSRLEKSGHVLHNRREPVGWVSCANPCKSAGFKALKSPVLQDKAL